MVTVIGSWMPSFTKDEALGAQSTLIVLASREKVGGARCRMKNGRRDTIWDRRIL
jgi:hypothetical protein